MFGIPYLTALKWGLIVGIPLALLGVGYVATAGWRSDYNASFSKITKLEADVEKYKHRETSYVRQIERYKAATKKSACASQIARWVRNPDEIPKDFNPHEQFTAPNLRTNQHDGVDTAQPYDEFEWSWPDFSKLWPF